MGKYFTVNDGFVKPRNKLQHQKLKSKIDVLKKQSDLTTQKIPKNAININKKRKLRTLPREDALGSSSKSKKRKKLCNTINDELCDKLSENEVEELEGQFDQKTDDRECVYGNDLKVLTFPEGEVIDLFYADELKNTYEILKRTDWLFHVYDEIALEGLDGITVEALWTRLTGCFDYPFELGGMEEILWQAICYNKKMTFYQLEFPRAKLEVVSADMCVDSDGQVLECVFPKKEIYPYQMVNTSGVMGSCSTFENRVDVTDQIRLLTLKETLKKYGNTLVIVAHQSARNKALINELADQSLELTDPEYGMLERVGRARKFGEVTQGANSLQMIVKDPRSLFHYRRQLENKHLSVLTQTFAVRNLSAAVTKIGKIVHLNRFYHIRKSKIMGNIEKAVMILRQKPEFQMAFQEMSHILAQYGIRSKIFKHPDFRKYIDASIFCDYAEMYPNAPPSETLLKNRKERKVRLVRLKDPYLNVRTNIPSQEPNSDDEENEDILLGTKFLNVDFQQEVFAMILSKGSEGISIGEMEKLLNIDFYTLRGAVRKLQAKNIVDDRKFDCGRTKKICYFARCFSTMDTTTYQENIVQHSLSKEAIHNILEAQMLCPLYNQQNETMETESNNFLDEDDTLFFIEFEPFSCTSFVQKNSLAIELPWQSSWELILEQNYEPNDTFKIYPIAGGTFKKTKARKDCTVDITKFKIITETVSKNYHVTKALIDASLGRLVDFQNIPGVDEFSKASLQLKQEKTTQSPETNQNEQPSTSQIEIDLPLKRERLDILMGSDPKVVYHKKGDDGLSTTVIVSTKLPIAYVENANVFSKTKKFTETFLARTNLVLGLINKHEVVFEMCSLYNAIQDTEQGTGRVCKRSVVRILKLLVDEGYIKVFKVISQLHGTARSKWAFAKPFIDVNNSTMMNFLDKVHFKIFTHLGNEHREMLPRKLILKNRNAFPVNDMKSSTRELISMMRQKSTTKYKPNRNFGKRLGYQAKMVRMQVLHELLFYLIYDATRVDQLSKEDVELVFNQLDFEDMEIPPIYGKGINWKMFIPPLPQYDNNFKNGWVLVGDLILRFPLSLFVKVMNITLEVPELLDYVNHPVKQHYLVKHLPVHIRCALLLKGNITNLLDLVYKLCFIGLVQLGPHSFREKEKIFVYLNRNTHLLDTSTSLPAYHKVSQKNYDKHQFSFWNSSDVEEYWHRLWTISMNTPLGQRLIMQGETVTIDFSHSKPELLLALESRTPETVELNDNGDIPGDRLGAGGLDSAMWVHLKRNWLIQKKHTPDLIEKKVKELKTKVKPIKLIDIKHENKVFLPPKNQKKGKNMTIKRIASGKQASFKRKILPRANLRHRLLTRELDAVDLAAIKKIGRNNKISWTHAEDKILTLARIAIELLCPNERSPFFHYRIVRDFLHAIIPQSKTKTSQACNRRIRILCRKSGVYKDMINNAQSLMNISFIKNYFGNLIGTMKSSDKQISMAFLFLLSYLHKNMGQVDLILGGHTVTLDYFSPQNKELFVPLLVDEEEKDLKVYNDPQDEGFIKQEVIKSVIHSSLNCGSLNPRWAYQIFKIYQLFPDEIIRRAVVSLKTSQLISFVTKKRKVKTLLDLAPFRFSNMYVYMHASTFSATSFQNAFKVYVQIIVGDECVPVPSSRYGYILAHNEIASFEPNLNYSFKIPKSAFLLNPKIKDHTEVINELSRRYHELLTRAKSDKEIQQSEEITKNISTGQSESLPEENLENDLFNLKIFVHKLIYKIPCTINSSINLTFTKLMDERDLTEIDKHLESLINDLRNCLLNLLNLRLSDRMKELQMFITRYKSNRLLRDPFKIELKTKLRKIIFVIYYYLKKHCLTNLSTMFNKITAIENDALSKELNRWLEEPCYTKEPAKKQIEFDDSSNLIFYKYGSKKDCSEVSDTQDVDDDSVPSLEIIKREIMVETPIKNRKIPYITDLVGLLTKEEFLEPSFDDEKVAELKNHFVMQYPRLESVRVMDVDRIKSNDVVKFIEESKDKGKITEKMMRFLIQKDANFKEVIDCLKKMGGTREDVMLLNTMVNFLHTKQILGATGPEIKDQFSNYPTTFDLTVFINVLVECYVIIRSGVSVFRFVHYEFRFPWLIETFALSVYEKQLLQNTSENETLQQIHQSIDQRLLKTEKLQVIMMPWIQVDGNLNQALWEKWLCLVLSHCLDNPCIALKSLCKKYCYLKPVDIYYILEALRDLKCIDLLAQENINVDLFSEQTTTSLRSATCLDNFENIFVETNNISSIRMGSYIHMSDTNLSFVYG